MFQAVAIFAIVYLFLTGIQARQEEKKTGEKVSISKILGRELSEIKKDFSEGSEE